MEGLGAEEDMRILLDEKSDVTWQCVLAGQKASYTLGCITSRAASRAREGILPSALLW